jgi:hypothetical protein
VSPLTGDRETVALVSGGPCRSRTYDQEIKSLPGHAEKPRNKGKFETACLPSGLKSLYIARTSDGSGRRPLSLTFKRVHEIRTVALPDPVYARRWRLDVQTVRNARTGKTWPEHPTPPDTAPRARKGNWGDLR